MARALITAPPTRPPRYGFVAAAPIGNEAEARWLDGFSFYPEMCSGGAVAEIDCGAAPLTGGGTKPATVDGEPFLVYGWDECSSFGWRARDWQGRARRILEGNQSALIADQVWSNGLGLADFTALNDIGSDTVTASPAAITAAIGCVEAALATYLTGTRGMIHVPPGLVAHLANASLIERDGQQLISPMGHIYVPDAGYDGSGPGGVAATTSQWIYGTSMMTLVWTPIEVVPANLDTESNLAQALAPSDNDMVVWAQRAVAVLWDGCAHVAAEVNIAACTAIGGS